MLYLTLLDALEAEPGGLSVAALLLVLPTCSKRCRLLLASLRLLLLELLDPLPNVVIVIVVILLKEGYEDT